MKKIILSFAIVTIGVLPSKWLHSDISQFQSPRFNVKRMIAHMSLPEKIGQMVMVGIKGKTINNQTYKLIDELNLGGVILYSHNVKNPTQVKKFTGQIQLAAKKATQVPLFIAVDQEGGSVARIRNNSSVLPSAMAIGATRSSKLAFMAGKLTAANLKSMGINMNLAPVLDVNTNEFNSVIGVRSYSDDPNLVSQLGMWYVEGLQSQNVAATAKHFPGHGATTVDSHYAIPTIDKSYEDLEAFHLKPFQETIQNGLDAIMTAHITVPALDPSGLPATLSYNLLTNVLRDKLGFKGVVITDDLEMQAIREDFDIGQAAVKSVLAGADMVMVGWSPTKKLHVYKTLLHAAQTGKLDENRVNKSVFRILSLKQKRGLFKVSRHPAATASMQKKHRNLISQISRRAVTVVLNREKILPLIEEDHRKILVVTSLKRFSQEMIFYNKNVRTLKIAKRPKVSEIKAVADRLQKASSKYDVVVFGLNHPSQLGIIQELPKTIQQKSVVVSFESPYYMNKLKNIGAYVCAYGAQWQLLSSTAQIINGIYKAKGKLPVSMTPKRGPGLFEHITIGKGN